jgi:hypothetical protein
MGGDKPSSIKGSKVLSLYMQEFERRLREPDAHVMIIGYQTLPAAPFPPLPDRDYLEII